LETALDVVHESRTLDLPRFGECTYTEPEVISFPWGLPGFEALRRFIVLAVAGQAGYVWLQSIDDLTVALPLCDPWTVFDDYEAPLPAYARQSLELDAPEDFCVLCVLVVPKDGIGITINLVAPIIVNLQTRTGRQITLENQRYAVRTPMPRAAGGAKEVAA
jgi:flagellar assembly factor FliW